MFPNLLFMHHCLSFQLPKLNNQIPIIRSLLLLGSSKRSLSNIGFYKHQVVCRFFFAGVIFLWGRLHKNFIMRIKNLFIWILLCFCKSDQYFFGGWGWGAGSNSPIPLDIALSRIDDFG